MILRYDIYDAIDHTLHMRFPNVHRQKKPETERNEEEGDKPKDAPFE